MSKKKRKLTRKQRAALMRGRRLACRNLDKKKSGRKDRLERQVDALESDLRKRVRHEQLKEKLRSLKEQRRAFREALRSQPKEAEFLLGSSRFEG